jgi:type II secretory pathway component GspD/PulD (secretin)
MPDGDYQGEEAMVSRATKQIWKRLALGLGLCPVFGGAGLAPAQTNQGPPAPSVQGGSGMSAVAPGNDADTCRQLVRDGRAALAAGDKAKAEKLARQAVNMRVSLPFWETDTPEKLLLDIGVKTVPPPAGMARKPVDPHVLIKQGQDALKAGKIDDAQKLAQQAKLSPNAKWGLFEETPEKLLDEVQKARSTRDKAESLKALTDGRKLYEQGKYAEAEKLAYSASKLHGAYGVWDFGDKPEKLLADIQTAKDKARKAKLPPAPSATGTAVANKPVAKPTSAQAPAPTPIIQQASAAPAPTWPKEIKTADVKGPDLGPGVITAAVVPGPAAPSAVMPVAGPMMPEPPPMPVAPIASMPMPVAVMPTAPMPAPMPAPVAFNPAKMQAMQCMVEGKAHQSAGRYMEARAKFQEAQKCGADFGPTDDSPDHCMMDLSSAVAKQIDSALKEPGPSAEAKLHQARVLAVGFALDTRAIDAQLAGMKSAMTAAAHAMDAADPRSIGQNLLDKARLELRRGQCETARQLATEVHNGPYGVQAEAVVLLRTIDVEEHNQRVLAANRNFDAGLAAYRGKDPGQAMAILTQVDAALLAPEKKDQLRSVMQNCTQPTTVAQAPPPPPPSGPIVPVSLPGAPVGGVTNAAAKGPTGLQGPMPKMTAPTDGDSLAAQVQAMQQIDYERLRFEGLEVQSRSLQQWERGETDAALDTLDSYTKKLKASKLDPTSVARLQKPIDAKVNSFKLMKAQKDSVTRVASSKENFMQERRKEFTAEENKQRQVKDLMKQYNVLYKEGKYTEAKVQAAKAHELDPDDPTIGAALQVADFHANLALSDNNRKGREEMLVKGLGAAENEGPAVEMDDPLIINKPRMLIAQGRKDKNGSSLMRTESAKEREIQARLNKPIQVNFHNVPLSQAIDDIRQMTKMNIYLETESLSAEAINPETPVTLQADNVSLKAALRVLLGQAHLTYVTGDEMLKITTHRGAQGKQERRVFSVADLVIPIDDFITPEHLNIHHAMNNIVSQQGPHLGGNGSAPLANQRNMLPNGTPVGGGSSGNPSMSTIPGQPSMTTGNVQPGSVGSTMSYVANVAPTKQNMQDMLIKLITTTVAPTSWVEVGGSGSIDYMPIGMALVITQTPDVQEQVADLLEALRKLQDLEVAVEVRIITLAETFFERIGLDFALNIKTDHNTAKYEPQLVTGNFKPAGQINDFSPKGLISGITGIGNSANNVGNLTSDLDIPIRSSSFQYAIPPFAYPNNPGFDGGLSLGLAFLSDIQVYMFMEAAQGDRRTNVMQAPKLTLFNGQTSTINVNDQQFFVTNVNVVGFGGQIVFVPINNPVPLGVQLTIQAVVSADRRFVRLNLAPTLSNLASATVPLFPVTTFITPVFEGGAQGQPIPFTQFIQQPQVSTISIQTTVSIPDGGTVILGGLKTLSEGRNEFGPPVLSKLPYIDRLFKNVGYGREAQSLLLMVTPRIIINSEEEERQTGEVSAREPAVNR